MADFCCTIFLTYNLSSKTVPQLDVFKSVLNHSGIVALMPLNVSSCCSRGAQWGPVPFQLQVHRHYTFTDWLSLFLMHCILPEPLRTTLINWTCSYFERFSFLFFFWFICNTSRIFVTLVHVSCEHMWPNQKFTFQSNKEIWIWRNNYVKPMVAVMLNTTMKLAL